MEDRSALAEKIRAEIAALRADDCIPSELRLDSDRWHLLRGEMVVGPFAGRQTTLFEGIKCVLAVGIRDACGYRLRFVRVSDD